MSSRVPSLQLIFSLDRKYHKNMFIMSEKRARLENAVILIVKGDAIKATPSRQVMFMKQLPTMLPNARSKCPFLTELKLVASSGMLVPKATIVAPMTRGGAPSLVAIKEADSMMENAPATTAAE